MEKVPFVDLKAQFRSLRDGIMPGLEEICGQSSFILGPAVETFEKNFAAFCEVPHAVGVANGTDALELAVRALDIGPGDEVIVPALTFYATGAAVALAGAKPVFVDVGPDSLIDPSKIEAAITSRTRALMPVHLYGQPADMKAITAIAAKRQLAIIEDCAQSHGARVQSRMSGSYGQIACYSFYPGKNLGAYGDGGAVTTADPGLAEKLRMLRNLGAPANDRYNHKLVGRNSRLDSLQAHVLNVKLPHLRDWNAARRRNGEKYNSLLKNVAGISTPKIHADRDHVFHLYTIQAPNREGLRNQLKTRGVESGVHYPTPMHLHGAFANLGGNAASSRSPKRSARKPFHCPCSPS